MSNFSTGLLASMFFLVIQIVMAAWDHTFEPMYPIVFLCTAMMCDSIEKGRK